MILLTLFLLAFVVLTFDRELGLNRNLKLPFGYVGLNPKLLVISLSLSCIAGPSSLGREGRRDGLAKIDVVCAVGIKLNGCIASTLCVLTNGVANGLLHGVEVVNEVVSDKAPGFNHLHKSIYCFLQCGR